MRFSDGRQLCCRIDDVFGGASRPAGADRVKAKFRANAALSLDAGCRSQASRRQ